MGTTQPQLGYRLQVVNDPDSRTQVHESGLFCDGVMICRSLRIGVRRPYMQPQQYGRVPHFAGYDDLALVVYCMIADNQGRRTRRPEMKKAPLACVI